MDDIFEYTYIGHVVHDGHVVVGDAVIVVQLLVEGKFVVFVDVVVHHLDVVVPVGARLLVE